MTRTVHAKTGFTLLEALLAIALTSMVMSMAWQIAAQARNVWRREQNAALGAREAWTRLRHISGELRAALLPEDTPPGEGLVGTDGAFDLYRALPRDPHRDELAADLKAVKLHADSIRVPVASVDDQGRSGVIEYSIARDHNRGAVGLQRRAAPLGQPLGAPVIHSDKVISLDCRYLDRDGKWRAKWDAPRQTPLAVRISVGALAERSTPIPEIMTFTTVVYLPAGTRIPR